MNSIPSLLLVGCGHQGAALLRAWSRAALCDRIDVLQPSRAAAPEFAQAPHIQFFATAATLPARTYDAVVLATRPQQAAAALSPLAPFVGAHTLLLSIINGLTAEKISAHLAGAQIVRAMPNLAASIGQSATAALAENDVTPMNRQRAEHLLAASGLCVWLDNAAQLPMVTALSGCGPAYVFYLADIMAQAGTALGLPTAIADRLARQTLAGAGALLNTDPRPLHAQWQAMALPGSSSELAMNILTSTAGFEKTLSDAVRAAYDQAVRLSKD